MKKRLSILFLLAMACIASSQDRPPSTTRESTEHNCELTQDDYAVFAALLNGLHGPEDPEEAWEGKEKETNKKKAGRIGALRLSQARGNTGLLDRKAPTVQEFSSQFLRWVESATLARKTIKYYANGWRLLSGTKLVSMRLDHIT